MRIALVLERFDTARGGAATWTARFAASLLERGHEVHVVCRRLGLQAEHPALVVHRLERPRSKTAFAQAAETRLRILRPDVIHDMGSGWCCHVFQPHAGCWRALVEQKLALVSPWLRPLKRSLDPWLPRHRDLAELAARQYADHGQTFAALSERVAEHFRFWHDIPAQRIRVIYNGVDPVRFSPEHRESFRAPWRRALGVGPDEVLALCVAHNLRLKGVPTLLEAVARLKRRGLPVRLVVLGGRAPRAWKRRAARWGIGQCVHFPGVQPDVVPYYAAADLYVHPTLFDNCSLAVLEAAASGLPLVTSPCDGASELFRHGEDQFLLDDPRDPEELARRIELLCDAPLRERMGLAARRTAQRYTMQRNIDQMLALYEEIGASGRRAA